MPPGLLLPGDEPGPSPPAPTGRSPLPLWRSSVSGAAGAGVPATVPTALPLPLQPRVSFLRTGGEGIYHFQRVSACVSGRLNTRCLPSAALQQAAPRPSPMAEPRGRQRERVMERDRTGLSLSEMSPRTHRSQGQVTAYLGA